jgi:hypothetical protein
MKLRNLQKSWRKATKDKALVNVTIITVLLVVYFIVLLTIEKNMLN